MTDFFDGSQDTLSFTIKPHCETLPVGLEIWFDDLCLFDRKQITENVNFYHKFDNQPGNHVLTLVVKNKTKKHTVIDSQDRILRDSLLRLHDFSLNGLEMQNSFLKKAIYHGENLSKVTLADSAGWMGFNGRIVLEFSSPADDWCVYNDI